jgi:ProP effector
MSLPTTGNRAAPSARSVTVQAVLALLVECFPRCFAVYENRRRPLKLGIHNDILTVMDGAITPQELSQALRCYVSNDGYLRACRQGALRIDLNGQPAGEVLAAEAANSTAVLAARRLRRTAQKVVSMKSETNPKRLGLDELKVLGRARKQQIAAE